MNKSWRIGEQWNGGYTARAKGHNEVLEECRGGREARRKEWGLPRQGLLERVQGGTFTLRSAVDRPLPERNRLRDNDSRIVI